MTNKIKVSCPHCKSLELEQIAHDDPLSFGTVYKYQCLHCGKIMDAEELSCMDYTRDLPKEIQLTEEEMERSKQLWESSFFIRDDESKLAIGSIEDLKNTIQFNRCERIIFRDKTLDFVFEIPEERYKDIDTIIVNGHKFVRDNDEHQ